ncbi:MAG: hypothetical protein E6K97_02045 [Thaumarchaeota archaeon]|nr:MAG: hypothetical protein E6K97_02045 [Nitrososphaerota archaeon]
MALADILSNSLEQRIGDYDIQINTVPKVPISGQETRINIRIATVSNNPIIDTPITIRISDEKNELIRTQPILLPSGHYAYNYIFNKAGIFLLSIDILDNPAVGNFNDSNKKLVFDFPITISEPITVELTSLTLPITITALVIGSAITFVLLKRFKRSKKVI